MDKTIRLSHGIRSYTYSGNARYIVYENLAAGRKEVFDILLLTADDPVVVGRELDLGTVRQVISELEAMPDKLKIIYTGSRTQALRILTARNILARAKTT